MRDPVLQKIRQEITLRQEVDEEDQEAKTDYRLDKATQLLTWASPEGALKIVVPTQMEDSIMWLHHEHPLTGHPGANKMAEAIRSTFYFKHLKRKCKKWTNNCQCKRAKARMRNKAGLTLTRPIPQIFAWLIIDIVGPFPRSRNGKVFWLTMIDAFSKDLELVALGAKTAEGVAKAILELWICRRGCPEGHPPR
jgi:hypothetical protein